MYPLSFRTYAQSAWCESRKILDSGAVGNTWHRVYLEASIPAGCAIRLFLAARDTPIVAGDNANNGLNWWEHRFGASSFWTDPTPANPLPSGAWMPQPSEVPFHPGLLGCSEPGTKGLFTALVQRGGRSVPMPGEAGPFTAPIGTAVRALRGRYLGVRVQLLGNGRNTPEIAALRVYGSRFSYVTHYLPDLYSDWTFGPNADIAGDSTQPDFLERFLDNFEGIMTVMEDRVASSYLLTRPETTPDDSLEWLASWIGLTYDPVWPAERRRDLLRITPELYRLHGTLKGLELALDTATGGMQSQGAVIVIEDYRLRRVFATILGVNLAAEPNPLLPDLTRSGNSFVGDTLFLGDDTRDEFLSLFTSVTGSDTAARNLFDSLANRVTVLVHSSLDTRLLGIIGRVVEMEKPAHVLSRVLPASDALLIGIASLLGVDTFLRPAPPVNPVRVDVSDIGRLDLIQRLPSLDPRWEAGPVAGPA